MDNYIFNPDNPEVWLAFNTELNRRINTIDILLESTGLDRIVEEEYDGIDNNTQVCKKFTDQEKHLAKTLYAMREEIIEALGKLRGH